MSLIPGRPALRTWPSSPGRRGLMCAGTPARRCGAIGHCQLAASGTG
jgi:hypothetical protein